MAVIMTNSRMTPLRRLHLIRAAKAAHLLLKEKTFGGCLFQLSHSNLPDSCTQPRPRGTLIADQRRACAARPWGKAGNERRKACFHPGGSGFLLPRGGQGHSQFYSIDFHVTNRFFVSFLTQERNVTPRPPSPLRFFHRLAKKFAFRDGNAGGAVPGAVWGRNEGKMRRDYSAY